MRFFGMLIAASIVSSLAQAQVLPPPSAHICVPRELMDWIGTYVPGQPWREVQGGMVLMLQVARSPTPCELPPPLQPTQPDARK